MNGTIDEKAQPSENVSNEKFFFLSSLSFFLFECKIILRFTQFGLRRRSKSCNPIYTPSK
jgi:hypothetical protein